MTQATQTEIEVLKSALTEAIQVIESLADQQGMSDSFYVAPLRRFKQIVRGIW